MIIQTGMRTDIPAFYHEWLRNRIREGYVLVRNPYNPSSVTRYRLSPNVVDLIAFCTKNPEPVLSYMDELKPYGQYWFVTITPYGKEIEPNVPDKAKVMESFKKLSESDKKVERNFSEIGEVTKADRLRLGKEFIRIGAKHGMTIKPCAEGNELEPYGADCAGSMTVKTFETALQANLTVPKKKDVLNGTGKNRIKWAFFNIYFFYAMYRGSLDRE